MSILTNRQKMEISIRRDKEVVNDVLRAAREGKPLTFYCGDRIEQIGWKVGYHIYKRCDHYKSNKMQVGKMLKRLVEEYGYEKCGIALVGDKYQEAFTYTSVYR